MMIARASLPLAATIQQADGPFWAKLQAAWRRLTKAMLPSFLTALLIIVSAPVCCSLLAAHINALVMITSNVKRLPDWLRRCKASLILKGTIECYYVFDKTSYRTGLNTLKNTAPYAGISLNFCAIQLDGGPVKTSTICFDNSGIDPNHPYVIAKVTFGVAPCSALMEYACCQSMVKWSRRTPVM
jgi:hypothetical protein